MDAGPTPTPKPHQNPTDPNQPQRADERRMRRKGGETETDRTETHGADHEAAKFIRDARMKVESPGTFEGPAPWPKQPGV